MRATPPAPLASRWPCGWPALGGWEAEEYQLALLDTRRAEAVGRLRRQGFPPDFVESEVDGNPEHIRKVKAGDDADVALVEDTFWRIARGRS